MQAAKELKIDRRTLISKLKAEGTNWRSLKGSQSDHKSDHTQDKKSPDDKVEDLFNNGEITVEDYKRYLILTAKYNDPSVKIAEELSRFLDKTKSFDHASSVEEEVIISCKKLPTQELLSLISPKENLQEEL